jgi:putative transcriptional regulator
MSADFAPINLTHHFLIAMPGLEDSGFTKSVVYLCEHSERGALGLVINKPSELNLQHLFDKVDLPMQRQDLTNTPVLQGGPLHTERGFVLHETMHGTPSIGDNAPQESAYASSMTIPGGLEMTTSRDVLEAISSGAGPSRVLVSLGYSSWGEGQLESELADNSWLTVAADTTVIFDTPIEKRYEQALKLLGIEPWMLSPIAGRA